MGRIGRWKDAARRFLRLGAKREGPQAEPASPPSATEPKSPLDDGCRPAGWLLQEAFARVMAGVEVSPAVLQRLYPALHDAFRCGKSGAEEAALQAHLPGSGWRWTEFEHWAATFDRQGKWPSAWQHYPALAGPRRSPPRQVSEALPYFGYLELRDMLNAGGVGRRPAPLRVEELSQAFVERLSWEELEPLAMEKFRAFVERCQAGREEDLCRLLARHLRATVHNLIPYYQGLAIRSNGLLKYRWEIITAEDEPLAGELAARFHAGDLSLRPPYFPGDQSRLHLVRV